MSEHPASDLPLFVYGTLLSGESNHAWLAGAEALGPARTAARYTLWDLGPFPALAEAGCTVVRGELYRVDARLLRALDRFEGCPGLYRRRVVPLQAGAAQAYVVDLVASPGALRGGRVLGGGDWRRRGG